MDNTNWTTRLRKLPHRVLDHPLSGAYAAWVGMAHFAITTPLEDTAKLSALGLTGAFGVTITAGRKLFIENDVVRKTKRQLRIQKNSKLSAAQHTAVKNAFEVLYQLDGIVATGGIARALPYLTPDGPEVTPWQSSNPARSNANGSSQTFVSELVQGAVYFAMQEPGLLTGVLPVKLQDYIVCNKPEWLGDYPRNFSRKHVEQQRPGLIDVAVQAYALHHESFARHEAVKAWLTQQSISATSGGPPG